MSRTIKTFTALVIGCFLALSFAPSGAQAATPSKIKVGLIFGMTGAASPIGPLQLDGAKLAIKEVNAAGGVMIGGKKVPIEYFAKDDESKPDIAIRRFRELIDENKVDVIVGQTFAPHLRRPQQGSEEDAHRLFPGERRGRRHVQQGRDGRYDLCSPRQRLLGGLRLGIVHR